MYTVEGSYNIVVFFFPMLLQYLNIILSYNILTESSPEPEVENKNVIKYYVFCKLCAIRPLLF